MKLFSYLKGQYKRLVRRLNTWSGKHLTGLFIFNLLVVLMVLLNTADYFKPFFFLSINVITFVSLLLSILLLGARGKIMLIISTGFWFLAAFFNSVKINIWAERSGIYAFQSFLLGIFIIFLDLLHYDKKVKKRRGK